MTSSPSPIALFVYNRPDHTQRTLEALADNPLAARSELIVFSDGPKTPAVAPQVEAVRAMVSGAKGFARVRLVAAPANQGLARSIMNGVTRTTDEFGRVIVVEDDLVTSPHFLQFMNDGLEYYADQPRVAAVAAYHLPVDVPLPETFFQRDAECWGWATWRRAWSQFEPDGPKLLAQLKARRLLRFFDQDGTAFYVDMLKDQIAGANDSWAVRWRAHVILNDLLSLYPGRSLVHNIGFDGTGTHSGVAGCFGDVVSDAPITVADIPLQHSGDAFEGFKRFNRRNLRAGTVARLRSKVSKILRAIGVR